MSEPLDLSNVKLISHVRPAAPTDFLDIKDAAQWLHLHRGCFEMVTNLAGSTLRLTGNPCPQGITHRIDTV